MKGKALQLQVGFSHRVLIVPPEGIDLAVLTQTSFSIAGIDKQLVGEVAAKVRGVKPPEPFRGKGIKYSGEVVRRKAGKSAGK
jgi:large subunit ribosomal protein L6